MSGMTGHIARFLASAWDDIARGFWAGMEWLTYG